MSCRLPACQAVPLASVLSSWLCGGQLLGFHPVMPLFGKKDKEKEKDKGRERSDSSSRLAGGSKPNSTSVSNLVAGVERRPSAIPTAPAKAKKPEENYTILKKLGEGAFGVCHLVEDTTDGSAHVLKRMKCRDKDEMLDALKEMVMMRICVSPFVVKFKEFFKDDERLEVCLVMEFCEEGDLFHRLREAYESKTPLAEMRVLRWFVQILLGLEAIHEKKFVHRDLKPGNIFLSRWDVVKLGDFGLGVFTGREKPQLREEEVAGTPGFIAPEILNNLPYDAKSDVYALGCCLYEMLTLRSAYFDTKNDCFPQAPPEGLYSKQLEELLLRLLVPNPAHRPSVKEVLADPLIKDRAVAMRQEQDLLQRVTEMEERIGYSHHERRKHAAKSYLKSSGLGEDSARITDVANELEELVQKATGRRGSSADLLDVPSPPVAQPRPAPADDYASDAIEDTPSHRVPVPEAANKRELYDTLSTELAARRRKEHMLERKIKATRVQSSELHEEAEKGKDKIIDMMEVELNELRNKNLAFELLFAEMMKEKPAQPAAPVAAAAPAESVPVPAGAIPQFRRTSTADLNAIRDKLDVRDKTVQELAEENRILREKLAAAELAAKGATAAPSTAAATTATPAQPYRSQCENCVVC